MRRNLNALKGIKHLFQNQVQRFITFQHGVLNFTTTCVFLSVIFYTNQTLHFDEWQIGFVLSAAGIGNLLGVFLLNKIKHFSWNILYAWLMGFSCGGLLLIFLTGHLIFISLGMLIFDGALSMAFVVNGSARQAVTPDHYLARLAGGGILISGLASISGNLFAGSITESLSPQIPLAFTAFLLLIAAVFSLFFKSGRNQVDNLTPISMKV